MNPTENKYFRKFFYPLLIFFGLFLIASSSEKWFIQSNILFSLAPSSYIIDTFYGWEGRQLGLSNATNYANLVPTSWFLLVQKIAGIGKEYSQSFITLAFFFFGGLGFFKFFKSIAGKEYRLLGVFIGTFFFLFNGFTLTYLPGTPNFVFVYLLLPWQLYFLETYIKQSDIKRSLRPLIFLAIINQLTLWVNLVFFFVVFFVLFFFGVLSILQRKISIFDLFKIQFFIWGITITLCSFWLFPLLYGGLIDSASTTSVLSSEKFYNRDSGPINVLRNLGYWGFFASNKGELYYQFSQYYRSILFVVATIIPLIVIISGIFFRKHLFQNSHDKTLPLFWITIILILFPVIGGINSLWPTSPALQWAFDNIPFFSMFRNTHKWMMLVVLAESVLLAFTTSKILQWRNSMGKFIVSLVSTFLIIGAWPFITNSVIQPERYISKIPEDWLDMSRFIEKDKENIDRIFLLPNQYGEVYHWEGKRVQIPGSIANALLPVPSVSNTCKGCLSAYSEEFIQFLYSKFGSLGFDSLLGQIGISHILQRDDYAYTYYKNIESPDEVREKIKQYPLISPENSIGNLQLFSLDKALLNPLLYSPSSITLSDNLEEHLHSLELSSGKESMFFLSDTKSNIISDESRKAIEKLGNYSRTVFRSDSTKMHNGKPTDTIMIPNNHSPYTVEYLSSDPLYKIHLSKLNKGFELKTSPVQGTILLNEKDLYQKPLMPYSSIVTPTTSKSLILRFGVDAPPSFFRNYFATEKFEYTEIVMNENKEIPIYQYVQDNKSITNTKKSWNNTVGNCRKTSEDASIKMDTLKGELPSDPDKYIRLTAEEDSACTYAALDSPLEKTSLYHISLKYRNVEGEKPEVCIWDGKECAKYRNIEIEGDNKWFTSDILFSPKEASTQLLVYVYSHQGNYEKTINEYADIEIEPLFGKWINLGSIPTSDFSRNSTEVTFEEGAHILSVMDLPQTENLIPNGSFENGSFEEKVRNCGSQGNNSIIEAARTEDAIDGRYSIELTGEKSNACVSLRSIKSNTDETATYTLSFDYKILEGSTAQVCAWNGEACVFKKTYEKTNSDWTHIEEVFQ